MEAAYYLYIIRCRDGSLYVGISRNVENRLVRHQAGTAAIFTRAHPPGKVVYQEQFPSYKEARAREVQVKKWRRDKKECLILGLKP